MDRSEEGIVDSDLDVIVKNRREANYPGTRGLLEAGVAAQEVMARASYRA
jgi:hypothetical protein